MTCAQLVKLKLDSNPDSSGPARLENEVNLKKKKKAEKGGNEERGMNGGSKY